MEKHKDDSVLLREYVKTVLLEDDGGGDYGGMAVDGAMMSPYGVKFGSAQDLIKTFVSPFTDVVKTAVGKTKEITRSAGTVVAVAFQTIATTLVPIYGYRYKSLFDAEKQDIEKIKSEYKDVYDRTNAALSTGDAGLLAFMACPAAALSGLMLKKSKHGVSAVKELLSALTGGYADKLLNAVITKAKSEGNWEDSSSSKKGGPSSFDFGDMSGGSYGGFGEGILREDDTKGKKKLNIAKVLSSKKFLDKALSSPQSVKLQKTSTEIYRKTLKGVYEQAENVLKKARTIEDLEKFAKKQIPESEKIKKLPPAEKQKAEQLLIQGIKKTMKEFYISNLKSQVSDVIKAGIPEDSEYVKDYKNIIAKIDSMI